MTQRSFYHSEEALAYRVRLLFNFAKYVSKKFDIPFTYDLADFAQVLPLAVQDQLYYCVDYRINPNGYDTSKLTAFLAYHLVKTSQYKFNSFPMFYGYLLLLQAARRDAQTAKPLRPFFIQKALHENAIFTRAFE